MWDWIASNAVELVSGAWLAREAWRAKSAKRDKAIAAAREVMATLRRVELEATLQEIEDIADGVPEKLRSWATKWEQVEKNLNSGKAAPTK